MTLDIRSIIKSGDIKNERVTFRATSDLDVGDYAVFQVANINGDAGTEVFEAFWFPYKGIKEGDLIVLYTKAGTPRDKILTAGGVAHFYYWGKTEPIWANGELGVVLLYSPRFSFKSADQLA